MSGTPQPLPSLSAVLGLKPGDMAAVMGAGGKATLMKRLVRELLDAGTPVIVTSTTNLHGLGAEEGVSLLLSGEGRDRVREAAAAWAARGPVVWVEKKLPQNMFRGLPPAQVEALHAQRFGGVLVVKTDGARKRLVKAPGKGEPVIPRGATHCLVVLGLSAIGQRAEPGIVHRGERVAALTGLRLGDVIAPSHLAALASHPESYPSRLPPGSRRVLYLSHCTDAERLRLAGEVWRGVPPGRYDLLVAGDTAEGNFYVQGENA
ncbi:MAG: putative selenium-dependent hydroxylase accessory protein YqeC [Candidatus Tectomicrobia bacterium]|uniref:Selenium-dependent hydroxylase accessory protein YqeC n=1 Tax=Tectimicrobiota bacterium TaxID=2528274 RepID=A0A932HW74_UNCTE|nr:putative selenium-dependent hydroxylase accessory protein YqeC [Candidatus Tectomicrobia bacterium]